MADKDFLVQLQGFSLTTAEILYRLPDHPSLLQVYIWQELDIFPRLPRLQQFLAFWSTNIEGKLSQVRVMHAKLIAPREFRPVNGDFRLN